MDNVLLGKSAYIRTFGCQMNVADGELLEDMLTQQGVTMCKKPEEADIILFLTCSVRAHAEQRVFSLVGTMRRFSEQGAVLGIVGCTAQRFGKDYITRFPCVDMVIGTHNIQRVPDAVSDVLAGNGPVVITDMTDTYPYDYIPSKQREKCSSFVPVSRGCSRRCTYCIVPSVRGRMISRPLDSVLRDVRTRIECGCSDIMLLGQNIDAYGRDTHVDGGFSRLLDEVSCVQGLDRLGFITSHPADFSDRILDVMKDNPVISPFFHLPPQSGSDRILKMMRRGYTADDYLDLIKRITHKLPESEIAGDFIVGFPGETEEDFQDTVELLKEVAFQQAYIFKYSSRPGSPGYDKYEDDVPREVKKQRNNRLLDIQEQIQLRKHEQFVGRDVDIIVEGPSKKDGSRLFGRTRTNYRVVCDYENESPGDKISVTVDSVTPLTLYGEKTN